MFAGGQTSSVFSQMKGDIEVLGYAKLGLRIVESHPTICVYWGLLFAAGPRMRSWIELKDGHTCCRDKASVSCRWAPRSGAMGLDLGSLSLFWLP